MMIQDNSYYHSVNRTFNCPQDEDSDFEDQEETLVSIPYGWEDTTNYGWR